MEKLNSNLRILWMLVALASFPIANSCGNFQASKTVSLRDGKQIEVRFEEKKDDASILVVTYTNRTGIRKIREIDSQAFDIWQAMIPEAERIGSEEGLIRYEIVSENKKSADLLLFVTEKTETGKWTVRKVN